MKLDIKGDMKSARRNLNQVQRKQIPFGVSLAMNWTANDIRDYERARMPADLDKPTPQVVNSIRVKPANKRDLEARVYVLSWANEFMRLQIEGGTRRPRGRVEALPRDIRLNARGNIPGRRTGKIAKLLQRANTFEARRGNVLGIWERTRKGTKLLLEYTTKDLRYQARFPFYRYADIEARRRWPRNFTKAMQVATSTAR
ncbi:MAG: hypothetical protein ACR2Q3_01680 [Woeseiaceae bacterium]